jgi:hypothetical protein
MMFAHEMRPLELQEKEIRLYRELIVKSGKSLQLC